MILLHGDCLQACADSDDPDQTARPRSLIWVVAVHLQNHRLLHNVSKDSKILYKTAHAQVDLNMLVSQTLTSHSFAWHRPFL